MSDAVPSAGYAGLLTELPGEFWRRAVPPQATEADVDFVECRLGLTPTPASSTCPAAAADTVALAAHDHDLTGVDRSPEAISHARPVQVKGLEQRPTA